MNDISKEARELTWQIELWNILRARGVKQDEIVLLISKIESSPTGAKAEREAIVKWLGMDAAEYEDGGPFGKVAFAAIMEAANHIESGDHIQGEKP